MRFSCLHDLRGVSRGIWGWGDGAVKKTPCMMPLLRLKFYINFPLKLTDLDKKFISKDGAVSSGVQLQQCLRQVRKVIYSI